MFYNRIVVITFLNEDNILIGVENPIHENYGWNTKKLYRCQLNHKPLIIFILTWIINNIRLQLGVKSRWHVFYYLGLVGWVFVYIPLLMLTLGVEHSMFYN